MILNVNLPTKKEDSIDLSEITLEYKGILIIFIKYKCAGFIIYDTYDDIWKIYDDISLNSEDNIIAVSYSHRSLVEMVHTLKHVYGDTISIKAIPFAVIKK